MTDELAHHGNQVNALRSALAEGEHGLGTVPDLLARVCDEESWREFVTPMGEVVQHRSIATFVTTPPLKGLGTTEKMVDRIIGGRPDVQRKWRNAHKVGSGHKRVDSTRSTGEDSALTAQRLAEQAPDEYAAVERGQKTLNQAAKDAGIRRHRIMVRLDDPESAARTLIRHMTLEARARLKELL
jgi:hypothetical protein